MEACRDELTYTGEQIANPRSIFRVCDVTGRLAGFYALEPLDDGCVELEAMFVAPEYIGRGFGRRLMRDAIIVARDTGADRLVIQADPNAEAFYVAAGGVDRGRRESASVAGRFLRLLEIDLTAEDGNVGD